MTAEKVDEERPIRIAFFEAGFDSWYGAQKSLSTLLRALPPARVQSVVVTTAEGALAGALRAEGLSVHILASGDGVSVSGMTRRRPGPRQMVRMLIGLLRVNLESWRWIRAHRVQVLYANNARAVTYFMLPALLLRIPVVWYVRVDQRLPVLFALALRVADRALCITSAVRERAFSERERRRFADRLRVLWTGFDVAALTAPESAGLQVRAMLGMKADDVLLLTVGSISERKGHDVLVAAFMALARERPFVHLAVAGGVAPGAETFADDLRADLHRAGLDDRVHWLGYRSDITSLYAAADLVVLPSRYEGLPRVVPEALANGRAVVASTAGGTAELLVDPELGAVVDPLTVAGLTAALERYADDPTLNEARRSEARRAFVVQNLSVARYRDGFLQVVADLTS